MARDERPTDERFSLRARGASFRFALRGLQMMLRTQHNARIHLAATGLVVGLGAMLDLQPNDWLWLVLAITAVWSAEAANTALEQLADAAVPERHPQVGAAKDAAAAGVLIASVGAAIIGAMVLGPPLLTALGALF